jgi:hypothetical protein
MDSAPAQFPGAQLSLFAIIGHPDDGDVIYWVWPRPDKGEPQLWQYFGQSENRYKSLGKYLETRLNG